ncbi:pyruvate kinase [Nitrosovibrio sp. Nv6]|uniref:pyruvate kinase n=1 Tax=Nitrosovibrio sp. Nv6 TaxID=1855340 RepID=UPI0008BC5249|nr:pyruvate kinase [Nitrosovibrio sp. Nv6]SEO55269.1 pyruvate kinase [Nitrosovibrio sp. Nv6]
MTDHRWHGTKIVCTLGPATDQPGIVAHLIESGMDVARINASHGNHADHARRIQLVRRSAWESGRPVAILVDLPGPKFRIGELPDGCCKLEEGTIVTLAAEDDIAEEGPKEGSSLLPVRNPELLVVLRTGESVFLADGSIDLRVKTPASPANHASRVQCEVRVGGIVRSGSGINIPESVLNELVPTEDDRRHLAFAVSQEAEWIGVSFVQSADDLTRVRALLPVGAQPLLMAKIEKRRALVNLEEIVEAADGVMVARGDLGVETDLAEIPIVQKRIIAMANAWARPVITATQMLESMVEHEHPTRAEVTDVANAVLDGTDAVMLSAETAIGQFPVAAVKILHRVLTATEAASGESGRGESGYGRGGAQDMRPSATSGSPEDALSFAACQLSARLNARAIIVSACNLRTALGIARFRPGIPLVIITDSARLYRSLAIVHGVAPLFSGAPGLIEPHLCTAQAREWLFVQGLAQSGDQAVVLSASGMSIGVAGEEADTLQALRLIRQ